MCCQARGTAMFFFGGGIQHDEPGRTPYGIPVDKIPLGDSHIPEDVFVEFLQEISGRFSAQTYDLLHNNCNNFTNECCVFLTGAPCTPPLIAGPSDGPGSDSAGPPVGLGALGDSLASGFRIVCRHAGDGSVGEG